MTNPTDTDPTVKAAQPAAELAAPRPPAGWYPDPSRNGRRYWDGAGWTGHTQDLLLPVLMPINEGTPGKPKSAKLAFVLGLLLGPFGMLYTPLAGFAAMLIIGFLGLLLFITTHFPFGFDGFDGDILAVIPTGAIFVMIGYLLACAVWASSATPAPNPPPPPYEPAPTSATENAR